MKFIKDEIEYIKQDRIFTKQINNIKYWIKPLIDHETYPLGNLKSHKKYFNCLKKYLNEHIPETKFFNFKSNINLIIQKDVLGKRINTLKEIKQLLGLEQNKQFKEGIKKMLDKKEWVIDFYIYKENFIVTKDKKLYFIDGRIPIFSEPSEDRFQIAKKRTLFLLS